MKTKIILIALGLIAAFAVLLAWDQRHAIHVRYLIWRSDHIWNQYQSTRPAQDPEPTPSQIAEQVAFQIPARGHSYTKDVTVKETIVTHDGYAFEREIRHVRRDEP